MMEVNVNLFKMEVVDEEGDIIGAETGLIR